MNWGKSIVLAFVLFMCFILTFVVLVHSDKNYTHELVEENYYQKELELDQQISQRNNSIKYDQSFDVSQTNDQVVFTFSKSPETILKGQVFLYRPSNKRLDHHRELSLNEKSTQVIEKSELAMGNWEIHFKWEDTNRRGYFQKSTFYVNP